MGMWEGGVREIFYTFYKPKIISAQLPVISPH